MVDFSTLTAFIRRLANAAPIAGVLIFFALTATDLRAERLPVQFFSSANGLGSGAINNILYDSRGFLWLATRDGLARFDGYRFNNYKLGADGAAETISLVIERQNGDYLVVRQNKGIYRFNAATPVTESVDGEALTLHADLVFDQDFERIFEDRDGVLWIVERGKLIRLVEAENGQLTKSEPLSISLADSSQDVFIFHYFEDESRSFWLSTSRGLLRIEKTGRLLEHYLTPPPTAMRTYLIYLYGDRDGRLWVESQDGIYVMRPDASLPGTLVTRKLTENIAGRLPSNSSEIVRFTAADGLRGKVLPDLKQTSDGRIWLASDAGLLFFDGKRFRLYSNDNGIGEYLSDLAEDRGGNLWIGSMSGVYKVVLNGMTTFAKNDGLGRNNVASLYEDRDGTVYAVEDDWYISRFDGDKFTSVQPTLGENKGAVLWTSNIALFDSRNAWWFLTENRLFRFDDIARIEELPGNSPSQVFESGPEFRNGAFYKLFEDSSGDIWTSLRSADPERMGLSVWRTKEGRFQHFGAAENFPSGRSPSAFCEDADGSFWIGFYTGGLMRLRNGRFEALENGAPTGFVTSLFRDSRGRVWVTTSESGASVVDDPAAEIPRFRRIENLSSNNARTLSEDTFGRIYVGTVRGVDRVSTDTNQVLHLTTADGLADDFVTASLRGRDGALWFGTRNGLSRLMPRAEVPGVEPPILIAGLRIAGEKQQVSELGAAEVGQLDLDNAQNSLQIDYFSIDLTAPERLRFQYKLEGADTDWSKPTAGRSVNYSNLAAGDYRFLVRAVNAHGLVSPTPATVRFHIAPPFWSTWWFSALILVIAIGLVYFIMNQRFRRFLELEKVRTRIATDLHDDIGASLSRISMLSELVKQQNGLADPTSKGRLTQIASEARGLVDSMSDIVWAINPRRDSLESVVDRICSFAADTLGTTGVHWAVKTPADLGSIHLTAEEKRNLYLIFKEAVNNAARHSKCTGASLTISHERGELIVEIADNGVGFASDSPVENSLGGRGLANMRTRARDIRCRIEFAANEPSGSRIIVSLPLSALRNRTRGAFFAA